MCGGTAGATSGTAPAAATTRCGGTPRVHLMNAHEPARCDGLTIAPSLSRFPLFESGRYGRIEGGRAGCDGDTECATSGSAHGSFKLVTLLVNAIHSDSDGSSESSMTRMTRKIGREISAAAMTWSNDTRVAAPSVCIPSRPGSLTLTLSRAASVPTRVVRAGTS